MAHVENCSFPDRNWTNIWSDPLYRNPDVVLRPVWLFICTFGNICNIILLRKTRSLQSSFLVGIACSDISYMWSWFALYIRDRIGAENINDASSWGVLVMCEFIGNVAAQTSDWILVVFSISRFRAVILPWRFLTAITVTKTRITIAFICLAAVLTNIRSPIEHFTRTTPPPAWMTNWTAVEALASIIIPLSTFLIILFLNSVILWVIIHRHYLSNHSHTGVDKYGQEPFTTWVNLSGRNTSKFTQQAWTAVNLLTASVILYVFSRIPFVTWQIILQLEKHCKTHLSDYQTAIFLPFYYQCLYMNYSLNFVVYCGVSRHYLHSVVQLVMRTFRCKQETARPHSGSTASTIGTCLSTCGPAACCHLGQNGHSRL